MPAEQGRSAGLLRRSRWPAECAEMKADVNLIGFFITSAMMAAFLLLAWNSI